MHLFVDISSHGFGHLALTAPVLNALRAALPDLRLTLRTALPAAKLRERIVGPYTHLPLATDFGFRMIDATRVDLPASAAAYQAAHADWPARVEAEARFLADLAPDHVLSNISYLPLAGAARAHIPASALCCLNWADLFEHFFGNAPWAAPIHEAMATAYRSARAFLQPAPAMAMPGMSNGRPIGPIARLGRRQPLPLVEGKQAILVALGGIAHRLPVERWPRRPGICWLVPEAWHCHHPDALPLESLGLNFTDLLASCTAVITKPGYGTFTEAAANGIPVIYQRRDDWPEQDDLIPWLAANGWCREISAADLAAGHLADSLAALPATPLPARPALTGVTEACAYLVEVLQGAKL